MYLCDRFIRSRALHIFSAEEHMKYVSQLTKLNIAILLLIETFFNNLLITDLKAKPWLWKNDDIVWQRSYSHSSFTSLVCYLKV